MTLRSLFTARPGVVRPAVIRPAGIRSAVVVAVVAGLAACSGDPDVVLAPLESPLDDGQRQVEAEVEPDPDETFGCGADVDWDDGGPEPVQVITTTYATTVVVAGERGGNPLVYVCDLLPGGDEILTGEPLANTGTDQPVGNDYVERVGGVLGRVDMGIPPGAVLAVYDVGDYDVAFDVDDVDLLRLHGLEGGSSETGFRMGTVTFTDADGNDVTLPSVELPDVIHGAPRDGNRD